MTLWTRLCSHLAGPRGRRLAELAEEVAGHWPHLPALEGQLRESVEEVEKSVTEVCGAFEGMAERARESVAGASSLLGSDKSGFEKLLGASRHTLEQLQRQVEGGQRVSHQVLEHMQVMEASTAKIIKALADINRIAFENKLVALNAKVEAARFGDQGGAFGVVADAIATQADRAEEITGKVTEEMKQLRVKVAAASSSMEEIARMSVETLEASRTDLKVALDDLTHTHGELESMVARSAAASQQLADEITRSIVALQFQDRVNQRLTHVADELAEMRKTVHVSLAGLSEETPVLGEARRKQVGARLEARYTMAAERQVARAEPEGRDGEIEGVELF